MTLLLITLKEINRISWIFHFVILKMPGINSILIGLYWVLGGAVISAITYYLAPGGYYVVMTGAIFWGIFKIGVGVINLLNYVLGTSEEKRKTKIIAEKRTMLELMISLGVDGRELSNNDIEMISEVYSVLSGEHINLDKISELSLIIKRNDFNMNSSLRESRFIIDRSAKARILKAMYISSLQSGYLTKERLKKIIFLGSSLGLRVSETLPLITSFKTELETSYAT